ELRIFNDHFELAAFRIGDLHASDFRGAQRFLRERDGLFAIRNDVDFFAAQFADDGLNTHALHADAGTDGINILIAAEHGNFCAFAGLASGGANLHRTVVNLGNFHFKQALHQGCIGTGHDDLRTLGGAIDHTNHDAKAFADVISFELGLLALGQTRFGAAHIHDEV